MLHNKQHISDHEDHTMDKLTDAQILLLAAESVATPDLDTFRTLAANHRDVISTSTAYRLLLTYLPLDDDEETKQKLTGILHDLDNDFANFSTIDEAYELPHREHLSAKKAEQALADLRLERVPVHDDSVASDDLSDFVIARILKLDGVSGDTNSALHFAEQFTSTHENLQEWVDTFLRPLQKLQNELYVDKASHLSLEDMENLHGESGVATLMDFSVQSNTIQDVGRDLDVVVSPWIRGSSSCKRRKLSAQVDDSLKSTEWSDVNRWLLSISQQNYDLAATAVEQWDGPTQDEESHDDRIAYIRTALAIIYASNNAEDKEKLQTKKRLLQRATYLAQLMPPDFSTLLPDIPDLGATSNASRTDLEFPHLLSESDTLTRPSTDAVDLLYGVLSTQDILARLKLESNTRNVATTVLFEREDKQEQELRTILSQFARMNTSNISWSTLREYVLWLRSWSNNPQTDAKRYLGCLSREQIELHLLDAMLSAGEYQEIRNIYLNEQDSPIDILAIQSHILDAILRTYDNASNGNRTRGGVKKASEMLQFFQSSMPDKDRFRQLEHLIKATHSLSYYQLTLQHGVPFQPVNIRVASDPLSLIEKVLDQNSKAYTKLDDLHSVARNLVLADLPVPPPSDYAPGEEVPIERRLFDAEHRVTYSAIIASLTDHDFDTAYSLITTRLGHSKSEFTDDVTWRAAYSAGRHRPTIHDIHKQIASLQKRMELLSKALTLAPVAPLPEILDVWKRCEAELDALKSQALQEERAIEAQSDTLIPGGFGPSDRDLDANETRRMMGARNATAPSYEDEAPMGLFDVAKGAASALRKNAFPLRGGKAPNTQRDSLEGQSDEFQRPGSADGQRVRKRDMLSNAVTGGLVSGMSWVLGAQPGPNAQTPAGGREGQNY